GPKGGLYTNAVTLVDVRSDSWIRIGSDFNGDPTVPADEAIVAADKLEANRIYNLAGPLITFHGSNNNLDGDGNPTRAARIALRGNEMVNNTGSFPISVGQNVDFRTFFAPLVADAENDHKPVLDTNSTTTTLIGRIPAYLDTPGVTEVRLEIYQADPVGRAQVSPDYPGGYLQGKEFLEYYFVDGGDDADPEPLKFRFDISALNLSEADLAGLTVVAAYYVPSPWGLPAIVRTSLFSETLGEPSTEGEPAVIAVAKDGNNLVFNVTGGTGPFQLQSRMDVATGAWSNVGDPFAGPTITIPAPATGTVFYQVTGQ
ncbi:MAG TPA: hypothetical protein PKE47_13720, partial [Verrucomicrobiota bacterium]|nr:hypothetical protein [Verrucomicrobiota bacterium]